MATATASAFSPLAANAAGIPVLDATNLVQSTLTAIEAVKQTAQQVEQYALQIKQYEDMVRNTLAPAAYVWSQAEQTYQKALSYQRQFQNLTNGSASLENYLRKFGDVNFYTTSPNFGPKTAGETSSAAITASKQANDALTKTLIEQQQDLARDASALESIQRSTQGAAGRMQAQQAGNQLLAQQNSQLLQLRATLVAQAAAENARQQAETTEAAMMQAQHDRMVNGNLARSITYKW